MVSLDVACRASYSLELAQWLYRMSIRILREEFIADLTIQADEFDSAEAVDLFSPGYGHFWRLRGLSEAMPRDERIAVLNVLRPTALFGTGVGE